MNKWFKQNITLAIIITLLAGYGVGAAYAAVLKADVERLKLQTMGMPEKLGRIEERLIFLAEQVTRLENKIDRQK